MPLLLSNQFHWQNVKVKVSYSKDGGPQESSIQKIVALVCLLHTLSFETTGKAFDKCLVEWKSQVEQDAKKENSIMHRLETTAAEAGV